MQFNSKIVKQISFQLKFRNITSRIKLNINHLTLNGMISVSVTKYGLIINERL